MSANLCPAQMEQLALTRFKDTPAIAARPGLEKTVLVRDSFLIKSGNMFMFVFLGRII